MAKLPKKIKIGHLIYEVERPEKVEVNNSTNHWGSSQVEPQTLELVKNFPSKEREVEIVIHEILHAIFNQQHLFKAPGMNDVIEEIVVSRFAVGITELFQNNPKLFTYIQEALNER